jgi:hypothetical protein
LLAPFSLLYALIFVKKTPNNRCIHIFFIFS